MRVKIRDQEILEKAHFDNIAQKYDTNYLYGDTFTKYKIAKKTSKFVRKIRKYEGNKPSLMLEIGCGTGEYTKGVARLFPSSKIVGLDISTKILDIAKKKCKGIRNISFVVGGAYKTGFRNGQFDVIYGFYVLHHLDLPRFKKELLRVLKPGGLAFFYEPNILNPVVFLVKSTSFLKKLVGDSPGEWAINPITLKNELQGFTIINISTSEFVLPLKIVPPGLLKFTDKILDNFKYLPLLKYLGGSLEIFLQKK